MSYALFFKTLALYVWKVLAQTCHFLMELNECCTRTIWASAFSSTKEVTVTEKHGSNGISVLEYFQSCIVFQCRSVDKLFTLQYHLKLLNVQIIKPGKYVYSLCHYHNYINFRIWVTRSTLRVKILWNFVGSMCIRSMPLWHIFT